MHGISMHIERIDKPLDFTPDYVSNKYRRILSDLLTPQDLDAGICTHCEDSGYFRPATYTVVSEFQYDEGDRSQYTNKVCDQHLIADTENFRDIGK